MEDLGPLFVQPHEAGRLWILIAAIAITVAVACVYVVFRGRLPSALSASVLLLLPAFAYILGDIHLMEESQTVEFCGSCHRPMGPIVAALGTDTETLAASHYRRGAVPHETACYECHSGYGLWGDVAAKRAGIMHMVHTITGDYEFPLQKVGTFDISSCRNCHAGAVPFRAVEMHRDPDIQRMLLDGEMGCVGTCHPAAHPESALYGAPPSEVAGR